MRFAANAVLSRASGAAGLVGAFLVLQPAPLYACSVHGAAAASEIQVWSQGDTNHDERIEMWVAIEDELVPPTDSTTCVSGVGLGSAMRRLPAGADVTDARVVVLNVVSGDAMDFGAFDFVANATTAMEFGDGAGPGAPAETNPIVEEATWFGFAAPVDPFVLPQLGPNEIVALAFEIEIPESELPFDLEVQFAAGERDATGSPLFFGMHPPQYFTGAAPLVTFAPEPEFSAIALAAAGTLALLVARRRSPR